MLGIPARPRRRRCCFPAASTDPAPRSPPPGPGFTPPRLGASRDAECLWGDAVGQCPSEGSPPSGLNAGDFPDLNPQHPKRWERGCFSMRIGKRQGPAPAPGLVSSSSIKMAWNKAALPEIPPPGAWQRCPDKVCSLPGRGWPPARWDHASSDARGEQAGNAVTPTCGPCRSRFSCLLFPGTKGLDFPARSSAGALTPAVLGEGKDGKSQGRGRSCLWMPCDAQGVVLWDLR